MKKVVIIEDKPWVTQDAVKLLQDKLEAVIYYPNNVGNPNEKEKLLRDFEDTLGRAVEKVETQEEFVRKMEKYYNDPEIVFLMDYELKGDTTVEPDMRINLRYARYKEPMDECDLSQRKIWFYTTAGVDAVNFLESNFPQRVLPVSTFRNGKLQWDTEKLDEILE